MVCFMNLKMRIKPTSPKVTNSMKLTSQKKNNPSYYCDAIMATVFSKIGVIFDSEFLGDLELTIKDISRAG